MNHSCLVFFPPLASSTQVSPVHSLHLSVSACVLTLVVTTSNLLLALFFRNAFRLPHFIFRVASLHLIFLLFFFWAWVYWRPDWHTGPSLPPSVWFHFLSLSHVCLFLSWCLSSADLCPFTLCPSHLIAFSVFHVIAHSFHPPTSSPALPKHSLLFGWSFLGVSRVSLPGSFLLRGPTHGDRERIIHGHWQTMGLVARPGKASMVQ